MDYTINILIDSMELRDINQTDDIHDSLVVLFLDDSTSRRLSEYYTNTYNLIHNNNRIILLMHGDKSNIRKQICMLMYMYNQNDIYALPNDFDLNKITRSYITVLEEQQPDRLDISMFIGTDVLAYTEATPVLASLINSALDDKPETLVKLISEKRDIIEQALSTFAYTRAVTEKVNMGAFKTKIDKLKKNVEDLAAEKENLTQELDLLKRDNKETKEAKESSTKALSEAQQRIGELENRLNQGSVIREYVTTNTKLMNCKVKIILYFKEIARINYINSFISEFYEYLVKILKKKTKLIVYDNPHAFIGVYKPIPTITSAEYVANRQAIADRMDKLVIIEPNPSILQDVLTKDVYEIVIVYDRLKQEPDIVTGNNVYKYYVINSIKDAHELKAKHMLDVTHALTNPGVDPRALTISRIHGYKTKADSSKLSAYMSMQNTGEIKKPVFDMIVEATNIDKS